MKPTQAETIYVRLGVSIRAECHLIESNVSIQNLIAITRQTGFGDDRNGRRGIISLGGVVSTASNCMPTGRLNRRWGFNSPGTQIWFDSRRWLLGEQKGAHLPCLSYVLTGSPAHVYGAKSQPELLPFFRGRPPPEHRRWLTIFRRQSMDVIFYLSLVVGGVWLAHISLKSVE